MAELNKDEYGQVVRANIGIDVSTNTALTFVLEPRVGTKLEKVIADGVVVGAVNVVVGDQTFQANEYLEYTTKDGDICKSGLWRLKGIAQTSPTVKVVGDYRRITVLD